MSEEWHESTTHLARSVRMALEAEGPPGECQRFEKQYPLMWSLGNPVVTNESVSAEILADLDRLGLEIYSNEYGQFVRPVRLLINEAEPLAKRSTSIASALEQYSYADALKHSGSDKAESQTRRTNRRTARRNLLAAASREGYEWRSLERRFVRSRWHLVRPFAFAALIIALAISVVVLPTGAEATARAAYTAAAISAIAFAWEILWRRR